MRLMFGQQEHLATKTNQTTVVSSTFIYMEQDIDLW